MNQLYSKAEVDFLCANQTLTRKELHACFIKKFRYLSPKALIGKYKKLGLKTGRNGRFKKGNASWNKGTKGLKNGSFTSFKKGHIPHNKVAIGTEVVATLGYIKVKIAQPNKWEWKHKMVWENKHGKLKKGYIIAFKDNNKLNCHIDNLVCITKSAHLFLNINQYRNLPADFQESIITLAMLKDAINDRKQHNR